MDESSELPFGVPMPTTAPRKALDEVLHPDTTGPHTIEVGIPMRDGTELAADIHLPAAAELPAPAIVVGTPYDKTGPFEDVRVYRDAGYVGVIYDIRGRGKSEGTFHPLAADGADGHDVVEWVAAQDWCSGKVGMAGISYMGWVAAATIAERPKHLCAAVPTAAMGRWQEEVPYLHGCHVLMLSFWFALVRRRINDHSRKVSDFLGILPVDAIGDVIEPAGPGWREFLDHETLDELWRDRRWDGEYDDFDVPCLHVGGWHDREDIWGTFHHFEEMVNSKSPARDSQWLLVGPWSHASCRYPADTYFGIESPGAAVDMTAIHVRFFDRFLRDKDNGVDREPRIRLYDGGTKGWKVRQAWDGGTVEKRFFLAPDGALTDSTDAEGSATYRYDPLEPAGLRFDVDAPLWEPPLELNDLLHQNGVVNWTSSALADDVTIRGWGSVELYAESDREDTEWHVKLADVDPDGRALQVAWGCLRASHGENPAVPAAVRPGETHRYTVELTPVFQTFKAGHRLQLVLASSEYPWFSRSLNRFQPTAEQTVPLVATNTVHYGGANPSALRLPVEV
jgi:putative CocE/NonD family hydrolase